MLIGEKNHRNWGFSFAGNHGKVEENVFLKFSMNPVQYR